MNLIDEERIILLLNDGNHLAFEKLYETYSNGLYNLALKYVKSPVLAEDALQYVFLKLWENHQFVSHKQNIQNFLFTILKNYLLNLLKSNQNEVIKYIEAAQEAISFGTIQEKITLERRINWLHETIGQLPMQKKRICELKLAGLSNEDISNELGLSVNTIKSQYYNALLFLKKNAPTTDYQL